MFKKCKVFFCMLLIGLFFTGMAIQAEQPIQVVLDGVVLTFDTAPVNIDGRTMVPMRVIFEALGADIHWDGEAGTVTATRDDLMVVAVIGETIMVVNGVATLMDVAPVIVNDRTLVPVRFISEAFGADVEWDQINRTVIIASAEYSEPPGAYLDDIDKPYETQEAPQLTEYDFERRVFELVNIERANYGLAPLIWHDGLANAARAHSTDMRTNNFMSHTGFDGSSVGDRLARAGISHRGWAENVAMGQRTPEAVMTAWMNSPGHRSNILHASQTHLGVGFDGYLWTQKFAVM